VIQNKRGTASRYDFLRENKTFISMPGVPHEMKGMMEDAVIPLLQEKYQADTIVHKTLLTAGVGESFLAEMIQDFENNLPDYIKLAYLPNYGMVRLRLTAIGQRSCND
jgi:nicotinamide-nucleotide amidase